MFSCPGAVIGHLRWDRGDQDTRRAAIGEARRLFPRDGGSDMLSETVGHERVVAFAEYEVVPETRPSGGAGSNRREKIRS